MLLMLAYLGRVLPSFALRYEILASVQLLCD